MSHAAAPGCRGSQAPAVVASLERWAPIGRQWRQWALYEPALTGKSFVSVRQELLDAAVPYRRKDELLAALVRISKRDRTAVTAIAVCLLPGLRRAVGRFGLSLEPDDAWGEVLAGLHAQVVHYRLSRRPRKIAANLIWDAAARLRHTAEKDLAWIKSTRPLPRTCGHASQQGLSSHTLWQLAVRARVLAPGDAGLINATRLGGLRLDQVAPLLGLGYEAAKKRRQRAEAMWVSWWAPERCRTHQPTRRHGKPDDARP